MNALLKYGPAHDTIVPTKKGQRYYLYAARERVGKFYSYRLYRMCDGKRIGLPEGMSLKCISTRYTKTMMAEAPDGCIWDDHRDKHNRAIVLDDGRHLHWCWTVEPKTETAHTYYTIGYV